MSKGTTKSSASKAGKVLRSGRIRSIAGSDLAKASKRPIMASRRSRDYIREAADTLAPALKRLAKK